MLDTNLLQISEGGGKTTSIHTTKPRVDYVDLLKGITILWIIWIHTDCYNFGGYRNPIFFFASGIFFKLCDYQTFIAKRWKSLIIPFFFFYVASIPFRILIDLWDYRTLSAFDWNRVLDLFKVTPLHDYLSLNVPLWFLMTLLVIQAMSNSIFRLPRPVILTLALAAILFRPLLLAWPTPFMINNAIYWFGFFAIGYLAGKPLISLLSTTRHKFIAITAALITMLACIACETWIEGSYIYIVTDLKYLAFVIAFMTFFSFFNGNPSLEFLRFYGKNSLIVLGAHLWILIPLERMMFRITRIHDPLLGLVMAILTAVILIPLINTMSHRIPALVGK